MKPGIYQCTADAYHADTLCPEPSLSASIANVLVTQSPQHAWLGQPRLNPNFARDEDSRLDLGAAAHCLLLERTEEPIVWVEANDWRTNAAKALRDEARAAGKLAVLSRYQPALLAMVMTAGRAIAESELAGILDTGAPEQTLIWQEDDGTWCRARVDLLAADRRVVVDYKSTDNAEPTAFIRQISRMGYDVQAEFYVRGLAMAANTKAAFVFMAQEITPPYECSFIGLSNPYRELGRHKINKALRLWRECMQSNTWPGYDRRIHYAEVPAYELTRYDDEAALEGAP